MHALITSCAGLQEVSLDFSINALSNLGVI